MEDFKGLHFLNIGYCWARKSSSDPIQGHNISRGNCVDFMSFFPHQDADLLDIGSEYSIFSAWVISRKEDIYSLSRFDSPGEDASHCYDSFGSHGNHFTYWNHHWAIFICGCQRLGYWALFFAWPCGENSIGLCFLRIWYKLNNHVENRVGDG